MNSCDQLVEQTVRAEYDAKADTYPQLYRGRDRVAHFLKARLACVRELLGECNGTRVLEVGCGPAMLAGELARNGCMYYGVDISERMIRQCRMRFGHLTDAHFSVGSIRQLDVADASFDVVLCLGVLEYVQNERAAVREMARVLDHGGHLILSGNNKWSPRNVWRRWVHRASDRSPQQTIVRTYHSEEEYRRLLTDRFSVQDVRYFDFSLLPTPIAERFPGVAGFVHRRFGVLRQGVLRRLGNGFVVVATKR